MAMLVEYREAATPSIMLWRVVGLENLAFQHFDGGRGILSAEEVARSYRPLLAYCSFPPVLLVAAAPFLTEVVRLRAVWEPMANGEGYPQATKSHRRNQAGFSPFLRALSSRDTDRTVYLEWCETM